MPAAMNKKMLSKSMSEPIVPMDEVVVFRGQQFVAGVFRMYDERAVISVALNMRTFDINI